MYIGCIVDMYIVHAEIHEVLMGPDAERNTFQIPAPWIFSMKPRNWPGLYS